MKLFYQLALLFVVSCSSDYQKKEDGWNLWKGRLASEISSHPYFKTLPVSSSVSENGVETRVYRALFQSQAQGYCQVGGGACRSLFLNYCDHIFSIKEGKILVFEQIGLCPAPQKILKPKN